MTEKDEIDFPGRRKRTRPVRGMIFGVRLHEGDRITLEFLAEQLGMSKADVLRRALAAYAAQVALMRKKG